MRITWVTRSFLDYRIPVYKALDELCDHQLRVIYNGNVVPKRCQEKIREILAERAIPLSGELRIGAKHQLGVANKGIRIPLQKGLIKHIKDTRPDVLISDGFFQWTYAPILLRIMKWNSVKHIMCYEKTPHTERNAARWRIIYRRFVSKWIDAIDCNGSLTAKFIKDTIKFNKPLGFGHMVADTEGIIINVANTSASELNEIKTKYSTQPLTFIYVGRLIPLKGLMELLRAWEKADLKEATLLLVGDGSQRTEIETYLKQKDITNVKLVGAINYDNLGPYYKIANCFIIPTLEDNWSLVVPEAMSAGLPIACSIYNGCHPELVKAENGWIFDPLNIENTTATLRKISESRSKLEEMGQASVLIVSNHTPRHAAEGIWRLCTDLQPNKY